MAYSVIRCMVEKVVSRELNIANKKFPLFASDHEGWAVMYEEFVEAKEELFSVSMIIDDMRKLVFDDKDATQKADKIAQIAINLACEAIQLAAMARKFIDSQEELPTR